MPQRNIIVIGASAGGLRALKTLLRGLQPDLPGAIFVVLHRAPYGESALPKILSSSGPLLATHPTNGEQIQLGRVYVAPPDKHLLIAAGHMHLSNGPKENRTRPAINPLFRSAALAYGPSVIGVLLSGLLDDGTLGLWEIKRRGGIAVVQEPSDAEFSEMAKNAIRSVEIDRRVPIQQMASVLTRLASERIEPTKKGEDTMSTEEKLNFTCPECHGPLQQIRHGELIEYKCRVGHRYSPESVIVAHDESEERILWSAVESLEEGADLVEKASQGLPESDETVRTKAENKRQLAGQIRKLLSER